MSANRIQLIKNLLGFASGSLPFTHFGVPIFKGKPRVIYLQSIADRIRTKLSAWQESLLSIMGKVQLVNSIISGMLLYSFHIYAWPIALIKTVDRWFKIFIWSGDVNSKKLVTVAWSNVCSPLRDGGLTKTFHRHSLTHPLSQLPVPCKKGDAMAVKIPEDEYIAGLESCNNN